MLIRQLTNIHLEATKTGYWLCIESRDGLKGAINLADPGRKLDDITARAVLEWAKDQIKYGEIAPEGE